MPAGWARGFSILACFPFLLAAQATPRPEPVKTSITVSANISAESPANVTGLDAAAVEDTPGVDLDDRLRQVPGFSLFRRSSSLVAHPTTQGISLRGVGSTGASRTLVLWDGIPANDPFGGWVYWTQFVPDEVSRVEISRGASTSVFGDRGLSGAISIFSRQPEPRHLLADFAAGNRGAEDASLGFSQAWSRAAISGAARAFTTDGYYIVPAANRGAVDRMAGVRFVTGDVHVDGYSSLGNVFLKVSALAEDRRNGTALTHNSTSLGTVALHYERDFGDDSVSLTGFHTREGFHSSFSSVSPNRDTERLPYLQTVPSQATGGAGLWRHHASAWDLLAGADVDRVSGSSTDYLRPAVLRAAGGTQLQHGVFAQADAALGPARFFAGLRHSFAGQGSRFLSPSAGVTVGRKRLRLRGSVYRAFRAPTLNELYREFRVGNTDTLANPSLRPETLFGAEAGADWSAEDTVFRITAYRYALNDLITNTTVSVQPNAIVRRRANAAAALSRGFEAELAHRYRAWSGTLSYLFVDSRYATGLRVPQVPRRQGSAQLTYRAGGTLASLALRGYGYQFDDDLNQFRLGGYAVAEFLARRRLKGPLSAEAVIDNLLDRQFYVAFTPTPNIGQPRLWRIGLRWDGP
ncbi:MAG: TonB-dependent receptor [Acidobacteriia bacterium]|nr:TonB-dependent receptor [Terriglobia bacterium]